MQKSWVTNIAMTGRGVVASLVVQPISEVINDQTPIDSPYSYRQDSTEA
ncbi:hypothetical protein XNA1_4200014 [Xenorhabdus nematophila str. Anatoliense]|nr:hypothetical protein XNA1_4200014 [Xenorhabdus nematophila str. Anatoliense]